MNPNDVISLSAAAAPAPAPKRKSAGLAWLLSMILPGLGHLYCGLKLRGGLVMGLSVAGMAVFWKSAAALAAGDRSQEWLMGLAIVYLPVLYLFGFLDAYFTAREINRGIDPALVDNPRVACTLNILTSGFGYFYLGERVKGIAVFVTMSFAQFALPALLGGSPAVVTASSLAAVVVAVALAADGYRIGRRSFNAQVAGLDLVADANPSHLPAAVPLAVGGAIAALFALILLAGMAATLTGGQPQ
jgi:hypothetical protein